MGYGFMVDIKIFFFTAEEWETWQYVGGITFGEHS